MPARIMLRLKNGQVVSINTDNDAILGGSVESPPGQYQNLSGPDMAEFLRGALEHSEVIRSKVGSEFVDPHTVHLRLAPLLNRNMRSNQKAIGGPVVSNVPTTHQGSVQAEGGYSQLFNFYLAKGFNPTVADGLARTTVLQNSQPKKSHLQVQYENMQVKALARARDQYEQAQAKSKAQAQDLYARSSSVKLMPKTYDTFADFLDIVGRDVTSALRGSGLVGTLTYTNPDAYGNIEVGIALTVTDAEMLDGRLSQEKLDALNVSRSVVSQALDREIAYARSMGNPVNPKRLALAKALSNSVITIQNQRFGSKKVKLY